MSLSISTASTGSYLDADEATLDRLVMNMSDENEFLILERSDKPDEFAQASFMRGLDSAIVDGRYVVEYRDGPNSQWQATTEDREQVRQVLSAWALDRPGWRDALTWEKLDLGF